VSEETQPETVSELEAPVAPAAEADLPVEEATEEAAEQPVRGSGPVEGASGEPGGSTGSDDVSEEPFAEEATVAEAEPAADVEAEAAAAEAPEPEAAVEPEAAAEDAPEPEAAIEPEAAAEETPEPEAAAEETSQPEAAAEEVAEPEASAEEIPEPEATDEEAPAAEAAPPVAEPKRKKKRLPRTERRKRSKPKREKPAERKPIVRLEKPEHERGRRQERRGVVVSDAMDKTIVVKVDTIRAHPRYKKVIRRSQKFHAHDAENQAKVGDLVRIIETRPLSKTKNWRLAEVVEAAR
jgi:small subunit ribosomal protein S17